MGTGFGAVGLKGKAYILTGQETAQIERAENLVLLAIQTGEGALGTGAAAEMGLFGGLGGIVVGDLLDPLESLDEAGLGDVDSRLVHSTVEERDQRQSENTGEGMDSKHGVGPGAWRGEANKIGVLHVPESTLNMMSAVIAEEDFLVS